jgi:hypothetical protein
MTSSLLVGLSLAVLSASVTPAQEKPASIPKVLEIQREFLKPGKAGLAHEKAESAFVAAMTRAKWPTHYIAMTSLSGKSRALFLVQYDSFEAWEKDGAAVEKNAALSAALDRASMADGELLDSTDQGVFVFNEELSLRPHPDLSEFRFMEVELFHVRPGKDNQWREVAKAVKAGYEKAVPDAHWGFFQQIFGGDDGTYLLLSGHKTLAEIDRGFADDKKFAAAVGEEGMKKLDEQYALCCEPAQQQLFALNPRMSYVPEGWTKASPDFWGAKPAAATAAKAPAEDKKAKP